MKCSLLGGTDVYIPKYQDPILKTVQSHCGSGPRYDAVKETNIQDLLFLENRDRKYDENIYRLRGIYNVQDVDFDMSSNSGLFYKMTHCLTIPFIQCKHTGQEKIYWRCIADTTFEGRNMHGHFNVALERILCGWGC